jgi:hypothetical protein
MKVFIVTTALMAGTLVAQETRDVSYPDFAAPAGLKTLGAASARNGVLRLTPSRPMERGAAWRMEKLPVREGFETAFRFRISDRNGLGPGADGFAFVIQNNGPNAIAGRGASGGFAFGHAPADRNKPAIANSLAVFFDTFQNNEDTSGNSISICTNGDRKQMIWPPPRLGINWAPRVDLKDGATHEARIEFVPPLLSVYVDDELAVRAPVDLARMVGADGAAYVGFTASTGEGFENHDILDWRFRPRVSSIAYTVGTEIAFSKFDCLPTKSLCTPSEAMVEETAPGQFHVVLPAHLPWSAAIPNPEGLAIEIRNPRGTACWDVAANACGSPGNRPEDAPGGLRHRTDRGRTAFGINDRDSADNQGYYEFEAVLVRPRP